MNTETQETVEQTSSPQGEFFGDSTPTGDETPTTTEGAGGASTETTARERQETRREELTADAIRRSVAEGVRDAQPAAAPKQYSRQELDQMFNVWNPSQEEVDQLLQGGEGALKSLVAMRDALTKQFGTLLQYQLEMLKNELGGRIAPMESFASEQAAAKDREAFFAYAPDLQGFEQLAQTVFFALKAEGFQAKDTAEAYKVLADRTRALIPEGANGSGATQSGGARVATSGARPARLSTGSQAGGGGPSAPAAPYPGAEIWQD
jgi:hypothetical protein